MGPVIVIGTSDGSNKDDSRCDGCYPENPLHLSKFQGLKPRNFRRNAYPMTIFRSALIIFQSKSAESARCHRVVTQSENRVQNFIFGIIA
jgi:hypothetical protein